MACRVCSEVLTLYGTTESVAPWLCECFKPQISGRSRETVQLNIEGCRCKRRRWKSGNVTAGIYCRCK